MESKEELERKLANLVNDYDKKVIEIKEQKAIIKGLRKEERELRKEIRKTLKEYRKFI